jgi:[acyl-carrier-protein] S-malonyltransferase
MGKIAFIYPGQGAQKVGMGKDFYENGALAKEVFDKAGEILDFDVKATCFEENEDINNTAYTQACLVTTCLAMTAELTAKGIAPDVTAGLSLGEYAAIATAGGMSVEDAITTVRKRGIYMNEAVPAGQGTMAAVLGMTAEQVESVVDGMDDVTVANYNCPGQIVITGMKDAVAKASDALKEQGAKRVLPLTVSGPFHSPFLKGAGEQLGTVLDGVSLQALKIPYVTNVDASYVDDISKTKDLLVQQVSSSVRWEQSMQNMIAQGVDTFVEIGPGRTLAGFMKKINKEMKMLNLATWEDLDKVVAELNA